MCVIEDADVDSGFRELDFCEANDAKPGGKLRTFVVLAFFVRSMEIRSEIAPTTQSRDFSSSVESVEYNRDRPRGPFHRPLRQSAPARSQSRLKIGRATCANVAGGFVAAKLSHFSNVGCVCTYDVCILIGSQSSRRHR